jgi:chromosome segregation ATPase
MEEMRQLLQDASEQEQKVQTELKDRDEKLATAAARIEELETTVNAKPKSKGELEEWADELERESFQIAQERRAMETDRKQLREDESELEKQMREMEVAMARERAMLARQEQELKRLNAEIQHELEVMQRGDGTLRERLAVFQRRHAEVFSGTAPAPAAHYGTPQGHAAPMATAVPMPKGKDSNGLLRKLFRGGE